MPTTLQLLDVLAVAENRARLTFNVAPKYSALLDVGDASDIGLGHYTVTPTPGGVGVDGNPVIPVAVVAAEPGPVTTQVDLLFDRPMSAVPCQYTITLAGILSFDGGALDGAFSSKAFQATRQSGIPNVEDMVVQRTDLANPQTAAQLTGLTVAADGSDQLGRYLVDTSGDYAGDQGLQSLKKRIFRIITTRKGAFSYAPDFGVGLLDQIKRLASSAKRAAIAADAEQQIGRDPEVQKASCKFVPVASHPGLFRFVVLVRTKVGATAKFSYEVTIGGTQ